MRIMDIREDVLRNYISNNPNGAKRFATLALALLPASKLKVMVEELGLENELKLLKSKR